MAKYIINIPDEKTYLYMDDENTFLRMPISAGENDIAAMSVPTLLRIKPYTELDRKAIEDEVWEFVQGLLFAQLVNPENLNECYSGKDFRDVIKDSTYSEARARYDKWKRKKKEIHVGDEVETESGNKACVLYENPDGSQMFVFKADGTAAWWSKGTIHKTGKNYPEVDELLKKMREVKE